MFTKNYFQKKTSEFILIRSKNSVFRLYILYTNEKSLSSNAKFGLVSFRTFGCLFLKSNIALGDIFLFFLLTNYSTKAMMIIIIIFTKTND